MNEATQKQIIRFGKTLSACACLYLSARLIAEILGDVGMACLAGWIAGTIWGAWRIE